MYSQDLLVMFGNISTLIFIIYIYYLQSIRCNIDSLRIFQGRDAVPGEFPYAVALAMEISKETQSKLYQSFCSGSIVTPVWTLTAGHCIEFIRSDPIVSNISGQIKMVIRYAINSKKKHHEWDASDITNTALFPGYRSINLKNNHLTIINDIGLLKTSKTIVSVLGIFSSVDYRTLYGHKVSTVGFGLTKSEGIVNDALSLNKTLQIYEAIIVKCEDFRVDGTIKPLFCLSWECNKPAKSCGGDSGGPVIHKTGIIGVLTAGDGERCDTLEKVYTAGMITPISPYLNWIAKQIRDT